MPWNQVCSSQEGGKILKYEVLGKSDCFASATGLQQQRRGYRSGGQSSDARRASGLSVAADNGLAHSQATYHAQAPKQPWLAASFSAPVL